MEAETATTKGREVPPAELVPTGRTLPPMVTALLRPEAYWHPADGLKLHETHISWIILAGPFAYKIKKPVDFGYLDFTTRERRLAACADNSSSVAAPKYLSTRSKSLPVSCTSRLT